MKPFLLDVNVMVALVWPAHVHNRAAEQWFTENRKYGFRTCPITQAGMVRILGHPRYGRDSMTMAGAQGALRDLVALPEHEFWPATLPLAAAIERTGPISGNQQITDAYLVALAMVNGGILATFDRSVLGLSGAKGFVEIVDG
ncbi:MAG: TA system VapC family ribonuclease toxin [Bryobacteraceae bacterium]